MRKSIGPLLQLGFWACYILVLLVVLAAANTGLGSHFQFAYMLKILAGFAIIPSFIAFYGFRGILFSSYIKKRKRFLLLGSAFIIISVAASAGAAVLSFFLGLEIMFKDGFYSFFTELALMGGIAAVSGGIGFILKGFISWFEDIQQKEALNKKNHEMELALIKAQINPHFLFNTINNIDILIQKDAAKASAYLNKLSDIMRFLLYESKTDRISLEQELTYIEKYIELQKIRTSNENYVHYQVIGETNGKIIPPMLFIPFIENAFKHTTNKKVEKAIEVCIRIEPDKITFQCDNKYTEGATEQQEYNGLGNVLIQKRLQLLYPERHRLQLSKVNGVHQVELILYNYEN